ncbi:acyl-CoA thioester hydrolase/BAAT C-terminal domain-containing protein [Fulvivirgaceae bacterium BMA12]|uniref:Acyl-CoA thioester hydrolase/BAAT C-terminal domain-containing protein n=1 Tax=Agaribacillus aureus TaxID=3051825 RepID=A0ABT8LBQ4_9BACT|nr:acyl-CoA thioester hydrolase/BAAT C-terminal domain-containing protein [Fulvivirgaceae bacterium BMA12]
MKKETLFSQDIMISFMKQIAPLSFLLLLACSKIPEGIFIERVENEHFNILLITQDSNLSNPIVVFVPGSTGGYLPNKYAYPLVKNGYDVLSIAYTGINNLPNRIEEIPLEYFHAIISWAREELHGEDRKIVLLGPSRGAELSLLYASTYDNINGIIAYSPSCLVVPESLFNRNQDELKSSWTLNGIPIPFAPIKVLPEEGGFIDFVSYYTPLLENEEILDSSMIAVAQIQCPVLLLSGTEDEVWPSTKMANLIESRMRNADPAAQIKNIAYRDAGHQFLFFGDEPPASFRREQPVRMNGEKYRFPFGGSTAGNQKAMASSQAEVYAFLERIKN